MMSTRHLAAGLLVAASLNPVCAQPVSVSVAVTQPAATATPAARAGAGAGVTVIEDDNARIEEVQGRSGVQRVTVRSKVAGARPYEVHVAPAGRDPSQERGNAGRHGWSILNF